MFETGHEQVDAEHRELLRQLDALQEAVDAGAGRGRMVELITILQKYAQGHFAREEAHMHRVACPAAGRNCAAHREFARKLDAWLDLLTVGSAPLSVMRDVQRESTDWIKFHITKVDCRLRSCATK